MRAAIVDVGSNTVRLLVARLQGGGLERICTERVRVGLGEDVERDGRISDVKLAAAGKAVRKLVALARKEEAESVRVLVTAPGRQADNAAELLETLDRAARMTVRVVSAEEEAQLAFRGAVAVGQPRSDLVAVCDLGGASVELAVGRVGTGPSWVRSVDLGALRLTTRLLDGERPPAAAVEAARRVVHETFVGVTPPFPVEALAVGGSARALRRVAGDSLGQTELAHAAEILASRSHASIARRYGVHLRRVRLLLAASLILAEVQVRLAVPLRVVEGGVREGALLATRDALAA